MIPARADEETGHGIDDDLDQRDVHAREPGHVFIAADRIDIAAKAGLGERHPACGEDDGGGYDGNRYAQYVARAEVAKSVGGGSAARVDRRAVAEHEHGAPQDGHADEGGDEGLDGSIGYDQPGHRAQREAGEEHDQHRDHEPGSARDQARGEGAAQRENGADGEVDAGGENHEGHAHRDHRIDRGLAQHVQEVADVEKIRAGDRHRHDQDDQADQRFVLRQKAQHWVHCSQIP